MSQARAVWFSRTGTDWAYAWAMVAKEWTDAGKSQEAREAWSKAYDVASIGYDEIDRAEALALARFSLISKVQELLAQQVPLKIALEKVASCATLAVPDGSSQPVAVRTLEDWWYAHQRGGFAALHPKKRSDRGVPRKLTPELEQLIIAQVKAQPAVVA